MYSNLIINFENIGIGNKLTMIYLINIIKLKFSIKFF